MFSYTFRMLSYQLMLLHELYESCFAFLFEEYIKQSQIWDTLPTSKMELFVTIGICKVISCRLMILYIQYCPMNVFICVNPLLVSLHSRWFYLQTSEMMLFVTITIANVVFYCAMLLDVQFLPMNLLFFVSVRCRVHRVTDGSTLSQVVPPCFR